MLYLSLYLKRHYVLGKTVYKYELYIGNTIIMNIFWALVLKLFVVYWLLTENFQGPVEFPTTFLSLSLSLTILSQNGEKNQRMDIWHLILDSDFFVENLWRMGIDPSLMYMMFSTFVLVETGVCTGRR